MASLTTLDLNRTLPAPGILPKQLVYILRLYLLGIFFFTIYRLILLTQEFHQLHYLPTEKGAVLVLKAFLMGLRFDTVVSGYILTIPFLLLCADAIAGWNSRLLYRIVFWLVSAGYVFSFFISAADLPNFHHFYTRISMSVFISADSANTNVAWGMVAREWRYYWALAPFFLFSWLFIRRHSRFLKEILFKKDDYALTTALWSFSISGLLLFLGIWGRFSFQSHIDAGTAYFSDYAFPNQLGLSPVYTFGLSYVHSLDPTKQEARFMGDGIAVRRVQEYLNIPEAQEFNSPIAREVMVADADSSIKPNVVLVLMETWSANNLARFGNPDNLMPFLDSLATQGYSFDSVFTSGIHTFAGIYSTLFAQPVIKRQHPMMKITKQSGFANTLQPHGYSTIYFTSHDDEFDNVGPFLRANGFERIVQRADYPPKMILSSMGVPDDYLYEHAIHDLDKLHERNQPFFATIMNVSNHRPYIIPKYFKPKHQEESKAILEYVDWSVRKFFQMAAQKDWFDNTIFIFTGDHGSSLDKRYDLPLSYIHTPLIIYAPKLLGQPQRFTQLGGQIDIFPTVMSILKLPYVNNTLGIDLFRERRPFVFTYADDKYGVLNQEYMYVSRENGVTSLYNYKTGNVKDLSEELPELTEAMRTYGESMFQAAQWLRKNGKIGMQ